MTVVEWVLLGLMAVGLAFMAWSAAYSVAGAWRDWRRVREARRVTRARARPGDADSYGLCKPCYARRKSDPQIAALVRQAQETTP